MSTFTRIAFRNLVAHRGRTLILGGAIAAVTALVIIMLALTSGIRTRMIQNATALSTGHVNVGGFLKISQSSAAPILTHADKLGADIREIVPEATIVVDRVRAFGKIISDENSILVPISGIDMAKEKPLLANLGLASKRDYIEKWQPKDGESEIEGSLVDLEKRGTIAFFASHAKKLKLRVGDTVTVSMPTYRNQYNTKDLRVAAILQNLGMISSFTVFMNHADVREVYDMAVASTGVFQIYLKSLDEVPGVEERLRKGLAARNYTLMDKDANPFWMKFERVAGESWQGQRLDVTSWQDETSFLKWVLDMLGALTFILTFTLMFIVIIGLINNLWMSIRERTSEIGALRAIGLQRRDVLRMFVLESALLSGFGVGSGLLLGSIVVGLLNALNVAVTSEAFVMFLMSNSLWLELKVTDLVGVFVILCVLLMGGALIPAYRASKMKPITAINHVS
jgi:ABC-type lipoprotein release transport system permease subunit